MNSVYRRIAKDCLVNWMGMSDYEAKVIATNDTIQDLENGNNAHYGVGALGSVRAALVSIVRQLGLPSNMFTSFLLSNIASENA